MMESTMEMPNHHKACLKWILDTQTPVYLKRFTYPQAKTFQIWRLITKDGRIAPWAFTTVRALVKSGHLISNDKNHSLTLSRKGKFVARRYGIEIDASDQNLKSCDTTYPADLFK